MDKTGKSSYTYKFIGICIYVIQFVILFSLQNVPKLIPEIRGCRPMLILPLFLTVSIFEGNYLSLGWGLFTGLILDVSLGRYIGLQTIIMGITGFFLGKMREKFFEASFFTFSFYCILAEPILIFARFYQNYNIFESQYLDIILNNHIVPCIIYTLTISPVIYLFNRPIFYFIQEKEGV